MKLVVIPDIHNRINVVDDILQQESPYDRAVFLGDYFDGRPDGGAPEARRTALWLKESLRNPKHIHCEGNHDVSYHFTCPFAKCSGYSPSKDTAIWEIMTREDFDKLKLFHIEDGWLFSHAGLHPHFLPPLWKKQDVTLDNIQTFLDNETKKFYMAMAMGEKHWFTICGDTRRFYPEGIDQGGLLWCDVREFQPIEGIAQIFGHTCQKMAPIVLRGDTGLDRINSDEVLHKTFCHIDGWNVCLDCHSSYYGILVDGKLTIKRYTINA